MTDAKAQKCVCGHELKLHHMHVGTCIARPCNCGSFRTALAQEAGAVTRYLFPDDDGVIRGFILATDHDTAVAQLREAFDSLNTLTSEAAKQLREERDSLRDEVARLREALRDLLDSGACDFHAGNQMADDANCKICDATWKARAALTSTDAGKM